MTGHPHASASGVIFHGGPVGLLRACAPARAGEELASPALETCHGWTLEYLTLEYLKLSFTRE